MNHSQALERPGGLRRLAGTAAANWRKSVLLLGLLVSLVAVGVAGVWLVGGRSAGSPPADAVAAGSASASVQEMVPLLTRHGVGPAGVSIDLMYAPSSFYEASGQAQADVARGRPTAVFVLQEDVHEGDLPGTLTAVLLVLPDGERVAPYESTLVVSGEHHRTTRLLFDAPSFVTNGEPGALTLVAPLADGTVSPVNTFAWQIPVDLPNGAAAPAAGSAPTLTLTQLTEVLERHEQGVTVGGVEGVEVRATYATREYAELALPAATLRRFDPARSTVFVVSETSHEQNLAGNVSTLSLRAGERELAPDAVEPRISSPHHRVLMVRFPLSPADAEQQGSLALVLEDGTTMRWPLPVEYGAGAARSPFGVTWATILAMLAGMVAAMWPCLFQLTAFFIPALAGVSAGDGTQVTFGSHLRVLKAALYFVLGFAIIYTAAGAMIGLLAGRLAGTQGVEQFQRYLAMGGGVVILILAVRIAAKSRAPLVCKMPVLSSIGSTPGGGRPWEMMLAGLAFATGCMTCFGAAMVITMVIYVGLNGSMLFGALVMLLFSLGMGIPLVIAAMAMARVLPLLFRLERLVPWMGLASSVLMVGFAVLLFTGRYMMLTEWAYRIVPGGGGG